MMKMLKKREIVESVFGDRPADAHKSRAGGSKGKKAKLVVRQDPHFGAAPHIQCDGCGRAFGRSYYETPDGGRVLANDGPSIKGAGVAWNSREGDTEVRIYCAACQAHHETQAPLADFLTRLVSGAGLHPKQMVRLLRALTTLADADRRPRTGRKPKGVGVGK